jgi:hypothetical protein
MFWPCQTRDGDNKSRRGGDIASQVMIYGFGTGLGLQEGFYSRL